MSGRWLTCSRACWGCARGRGSCRSAWWRSTARRSRPARRLTPTVTSTRSRGRSSPRRPRRTGARMSSMATRVATSCPSICARARGGARRCAKAKARLERERGHASEAAGEDDEEPVSVELDPRDFVTRPQGRRAWVREGRRALQSQRERQGRPIAKDRSDRLFEACRRLEEELDVEHASHDAYEAWRARGVAADGSRGMARGMVKPHEPVLVPAGTVNTTDHDSRVMRTQGQPPLQGYNAQLAVNDRQVIVAAEVTTDAPDFGHLDPMVRATRRELRAVDVDEPAIVVADAGYWHQRQIETVVSDGIQVLVPPDSGLRTAPRPGWTGGLYDFMRRVLATPVGRAAYRTADHHRARLRPAEVQPPDQTLPTPRPRGLSVGMAAHRSNPPSPQAPQSPPQRRHRVTRAAPPGPPLRSRATPWPTRAASFSTASPRSSKRGAAR